jgi:hypothetical protein
LIEYSGIGQTFFRFEPRIICGEDHHFGDESLLIAHEHLSRSRSIEQTLRNLGGRIPKRIFCVPFLPDDLLTAISLHNVFKAPLCLYLMDDQNVTASRIPDSLMREFLTRCSLRLTTHSEMREAYESKYGLKFYLLPAVVPARLISAAVSEPEPELVREQAGALVGSVWGRKWFDRLKTVIGDSGLACHWFGNHQSPAFRISAQELVEAGIQAHGVVSEEVLAHQLRRFPFAIVPLARWTKMTMPYGPVLSVCREEFFSFWQHQTHPLYLWGVPKLLRQG